MSDPHVYRDSGCSDQGIELCSVYGYESFALVVCGAVSLSIEHGNNDGSCVHYVWLSFVAGHRFGDYKNALRFSQLGYDLVEKRGLKRFQAATYAAFANGIMPWSSISRLACNVTRQAFEIAKTIGDLTTQRTAVSA